MHQSHTSTDNDAFDVAICGGGLAGLTLARQLRRELPTLRIAVVDRLSRPLPEASHKVGESSVELGSQYLERLGLRDYLLERHLIKFGLRFFPGGGQLPVEERFEIGPSQEPPVHSYQIDRGRFENDLREMNAADGVTLFEGYRVSDVDMAQGGAGELHQVRLVPVPQAESDGQPQALGAVRSLCARWVVDATGRYGMFRKKLKLKRGTNHAANAGWLRVKGRIDVTSFVPQPSSGASAPQRAWHEQPFASQRWRSTNHFMGPGYWVWFIPLSSGNTSVGVVVHDEYHPFTSVSSLAAVREFLDKHEPALAKVMQDTEVLDFRCLHSYSHNAARCWSTERWALVGEAGAFVDPLYSPGTDFIAFANSFTAELIRADFAEEELAPRVQQMNLQYRALVMGGIGVFRLSAPVYGHARGMCSKVYWDNFAYWSFPCQYFLQEIYRVSGPLHTTLTMVGARFVELSGYVQAFLRAWAELCPEPPKPGFIGLPQFPSLLVQAHLDLQKKMTPEETLEHIRLRVAQGEQMVFELFLRIAFEVGPERTSQLLERAGAAAFELHVDSQRLEAEKLSSLERRRALSEVALDVERNLGRVTKHSEWEAAGRALLQLPRAVIGNAEADKATLAAPTRLAQ